MVTKPSNVSKGSAPKPVTPNKPVKAPAPRPPQRTPGPRPAPNRPPDAARPSYQRPSTVRPIIDDRETPKVRWEPAAKAFRRGLGLAVLFDMSNVEGDQTLGALSPAWSNPLAEALVWPPEFFEPITKGNVIVGAVVRPVDVPIVAPFPIEVPDDAPYIDPLPMRSPRPKARPYPAAPPVERPAVKPVPVYEPHRPVSPRREKTQYETTIVIERDLGPKEGIRIRARQAFKYQIYARTMRRIDAKGVYLRLMQMVTLTFGTLTEVQDFVDALAVNIVDAQGRPVIHLGRDKYLDIVKPAKGSIADALVVSSLGYYEAFDGLLEGRYSLDLGGFAFDYVAMQAGDWEAALPSKAYAKVAKALGLDMRLGVETMMNMHRRLAGLSRMERESYVWELRKAYRAQFAGRVYWSKRGLSSRAAAW